MPETSAPLVGMRFRPPALTIVQGLGMDEPLLLRREPSNHYDPNAIQVFLLDDWAETNPTLAIEAKEEAESLGNEFDLEKGPFLGYIAREYAAAWAPVFDQVLEEEKELPAARLTFSATGSPMVTLTLPSPHLHHEWVLSSDGEVCAICDVLRSEVEDEEPGGGALDGVENVDEINYGDN